MSESVTSTKSAQLLEEVLTFVRQSQGLKLSSSNDGVIRITQSVDAKSFAFRVENLTEIVHRFDTDGKVFIQVNLNAGLKVLLTETLVGFKPVIVTGLDMSKLPKVVTTPDLVSVLEAIEEALSGDSALDQEFEILKRVYQAILQGGEAAGFDLTFEKLWLSRLTPSHFRASA